MIAHKHKGARAELIACAWLLENGYEVFRNVSQHGKIDIIGMRGGGVTFFDVKSDNGSAYRNKIPPSGVAYILVDATGKCSLLDPQR